jgi:YkoY family integral membrane protein
MVAIVALVALEILLSVDNAAVLAVMVKHLPKDQQAKALKYGLAGAVIFRFACFFIIGLLMKWWIIQALGALYLLYIGIKGLTAREADGEEDEKQSKAGFWPTVLKVEVMDIVFAIDSMLAAIAFAVGLKELGWFKIGGLDAGHFGVIMIGGLLGVITIRYAATGLLKVMETRPNLEKAAYGLVTLVGVKLLIITFAHPGFHAATGIDFVTDHFAHGALVKGIFWGFMLIIVLAGWFTGAKKIEESISKEA